MGYELKIFFVRAMLNTQLPGEKRVFASIMSEIDLCKPGEGPLLDLKAKIDQEDLHECFVYGLDGNTEFTEDSYGKSLKLVPVQRVRDALAKAFALTCEPGGGWAGRGYPRFHTGLVMATEFADPDLYNPEVTFCVLYGH